MKILVLILAWDITDYLPRFAEVWKESFFFARGFGLVVVSCLPYNFGIILLLLYSSVITFFLKMWGKTVWIGKGLNRS